MGIKYHMMKFEIGHNKTSIEAMLVDRQLLCVGHIILILEKRIPRRAFSELESVKRVVGYKYNRHRDHTETTLKIYI